MINARKLAIYLLENLRPDYASEDYRYLQSKKITLKE